MADNKQPQSPSSETPSPDGSNEPPKKKKLTLDIDEVDTSEVLERKISA